MNCNFGSAKDSGTNPFSYFSNVSLEYNLYRPSYPEMAIAKMLEGLTPTQLVAADIGAGTGIGSRLLGDQGIQN